MVQDQGFFSKNILLEGKSAVVTGSSRGIGRAISTRLASDGFFVALIARNAEALFEVQAEIEEAGGSARLDQRADQGRDCAH